VISVLRLYAPVIVVMIGGFSKAFVYQSVQGSAFVDGTVLILLGLALIVHIRELQRRRRDRDEP
jgi:hypothetical protein